MSPELSFFMGVVIGILLMLYVGVRFISWMEYKSRKSTPADIDSARKRKDDSK